MEFVYQFLRQHGFGHPLHPAASHMPIGLVVGAFIFLLVSVVFKQENLRQTARCCIVLALIFLPPAAILGVTDWLHFYSGDWLYLIKIKVILTVALSLLLVAAVIMEIKEIGGLMGRLFVYLLCLVAVIALGYFGGALVFPEQSYALSDQLQAGEKLYASNCAGCHPGGGNVITPAAPVKGSTQLKDLETFSEFNRAPVKPDGSKGVMPAFPREKISDAEMKLLYLYVTQAMK
ncbi:MAG TPA: c-type cytochrome [Syntrophales bacterium]|nr:c-type cytochrome [Syntrophales bacterium]